MGFNYTLGTAHNDKKSRNSLFACHILAGIINLFINTFLVAYIYSFNGNVYDYIYNVGIFNIVGYGSMLLFYLPLSYIVDKTNRVYLYRVGIMLRAALVILVIFCGEQLAQLLFVAGLLQGLSEAFYYSSYNVLKEEMVSRNNVKGYASAIYVISKIVEIACPIALGALIDVTTYTQVAFIVLGICLTQIIISLYIKAQRPTGSHFSLKELFSRLKDSPIASKKLKFLYIICILYGSVSFITIALNICIILEFGSNFSLGALTSIFALISIITLLLVNKFTKPGKRFSLSLILGLLPIISSLSFLIEISMLTIVIYNFTIAVSSIVLKYNFDVYRNSTLKAAGLYDEIAEHHTVVESLLNISRVILFGIMLAVSLLQSMLAFIILIIVTTILNSLVLILLAVYEKKFINVE